MNKHLKSVLGRLWSIKPHWVLALAAIVLVGVALVAVRWLLGPEVVVYRVVSGDIVRSVVASGHVETPFRVEIGSQITATVAEVLVEEGQTVKRGQQLVALETAELNSAVVQAEGAVDRAQARLRQMREVSLPGAQEALKQARANLVNAEAAFARADQLARTGYGTRVSLDAATRDLDVARTQVRTAELQVYTASVGGSDYVMAETELNQAEAALANAKARLGYTKITAPRDGVLITRSVERGTVVQPGKTLLVLAPSGDVQLVLQIDEKNLGLLKLGQDALASTDAYPEQRFAAKLTYINPSVDINRASVEVKLTVIDPPAYLRQDMTVSVDIEVDRRNGTVVAPVRAVHDATSAAPWVLVMRDGRPRAQTVRLGLRGADQVEILDGLKADDLVVPVASGVRAGQRIRAVAS